MLAGNYSSKLDQKKGRTALPSRFRKILGKKVVITLGYEGSLIIIASKDWQQVTKDIVNKPFITKPAREIDRFLLGNAYELVLDEQGRFIIPLALRQYAKLDKEAVFVGMGNRVEVWSQTRWEKHLAYLKQNIDQITKKLSQIDKDK